MARATTKPASWRKVPMLRGQGQMWQSERRHDTFRHRLGSNGPLRSFRAESVGAAREHILKMGWVRPDEPELVGMTLGQLLQTWLAWRSGDSDARPNTLKADRTRIRQLESTCVDLWASPLNRITPEDLEAAYRDLRAAPYAQRTVKGVHDTLSAAYTWAARKWGLAHIPRLATAPRTVEAEDREAIPADHLEKIIGAAREHPGTPFHLFIELVAGTGMRKGEALGVEGRDLNLRAETVSIERQRNEYGVGPLKTKRSRRVADLVTESAVAALREYAGAPDESVVQASPDHVQRRWRAVVDAFGWDYTIHQVRHSVATALLADNVPLIDVAAQLGDSPAMVQRVYGHAIPGRHREKMRSALSW